MGVIILRFFLNSLFYERLCGLCPEGRRATDFQGGRARHPSAEEPGNHVHNARHTNHDYVVQKRVKYDMINKVSH